MSFSTDKHSIAHLMMALQRIKTLYKKATTNINGANTKIVLRGDMGREIGIVARAFGCICKNDIDIKLITTSENEISIVVSDGDVDAVCDIYEKEFNS